MTDHFEKLVLKNFLSWEKGVFNFHPGVNMFIGKSDGGKSAVMDAFFKLFYNRPMGNDFQSWWGGQTLISLQASGRKVRYKKDKLASYEMKDLSTGKLTIFDAPKTTVPDPITNFLNMNRKINFQKQLEKKAPIFLLSESPSDISKHLNEVARLENIDISLDKGKKEVKKGETEQKAIDFQIHAKTKKLKKYGALDKLNMLVSHAEKIQKNLDRDTALQSRLQESLDDYTQAKEKLKKLREKLVVAPLIRGAINRYQKFKAYDDQIKSFEYNLTDVMDVSRMLKEVRDKKEIAPYIRRCSNLLLIIADYDEKIEKLTETKDNIIETKDKIRITKQLIKMGRKKLKKEFPATCPLCNQVVQEDLL